MRILVTGHRGYIGSLLADRVRAAGHDVVGVDTELYEECTFGGHKPSAIPTIHRDIRELSPSDLEGIDGIAHLAGVCNDPLGDLLPETTYDINYAATVRLAKIAKASGVRRFVFSSTCSVYGAAGQEWIDEQSEPNPITPYAISKWKAEDEYAVDINPYRVGKFLPGTGQRIVAPAFLRDYRPDNVVIMNPVYRDEIARELASLGCEPRVYTILNLETEPA